MVVEILVAERQGEDPLRQQRAHRVLDAARLAVVDEASRQPLEQPDGFISLLQQQRPAIGADLPSVERPDHSAPLNA